MEAPDSLMTQCFTTDLHPPHSSGVADNDNLADRTYELVRWIGWLAFGAHVITIGMSILVTQIITVVLIVVPTIGICLDLSRKRTCNSHKIGCRLRATVVRWGADAQEKRRMDAYARLNLDENGEKQLKKWDLTPDDSNADWWEQYQGKKEHYQRAWRQANEQAGEQTRHGAGGLTGTEHGQELSTLQSPPQTATQENGHAIEPGTVNANAG